MEFESLVRCEQHSTKLPIIWSIRFLANEWFAIRVTYFVMIGQRLVCGAVFIAFLLWTFQSYVRIRLTYFTSLHVGECIMNVPKPPFA